MRSCGGRSPSPVLGSNRQMHEMDPCLRSGTNCTKRTSSILAPVPCLRAGHKLERQFFLSREGEGCAGLAACCLAAAGYGCTSLRGSEHPHPTAPIFVPQQGYLSFSLKGEGKQRLPKCSLPFGGEQIPFLQAYTCASLSAMNRIVVTPVTPAKKARFQRQSVFLP